MKILAGDTLDPYSRDRRFDSLQHHTLIRTNIIVLLRSRAGYTNTHLTPDKGSIRIRVLSLLANSLQTIKMTKIFKGRRSHNHL